MKSLYDLIRTVHFTEKSEGLRSKQKYTFEVDPSATKKDIKKAVEEIFHRRVEKVNVLNREGKLRRTRYGYGKRADKKLAIVTLKEGEEPIKFE